MQLSNFFRLALVVLFFAGAALFCVSFIIQYRVLDIFVGSSVVALVLTLALEVGKASAVVWHRYLSMQPGIYPPATRVASMTFRIGLVVLSMLCSMLFLADRLDRPNLDMIRDADLESLDANKQLDISRIDSERKRRIELLREQYRSERERIFAAHEMRIGDLRSALREEMDNVVRGKFKGPRYRELERLVEKEEDSLQRYLATLDERQAVRIAELEQDMDERIRHLTTEYKRQRRDLITHDYAQDDRVNDPYIVAFLSISKAMLPGEIDTLQFVFAFSILISVLLEIGIMLAFDTVTVTLLPAIQTQHHEDIETEILKSRVAAQARQEEIRHASKLDRISSAANRTINCAERLRNSSS